MNEAASEPNNSTGAATFCGLHFGGRVKASIARVLSAGMVRPRQALGWLGVDVACVLVFCAVGRRSHDEGLDVAGIATTAWPFLSGTAVGWLAVRAWRHPTDVAPTGVVVWLCTVAVGMLLRKATSAGVAASFVLVASTVTALLLLGWRAALLLSARKPN